MAGDIKAKYGTPLAFTVTNLHSLAASSSRTAGWTSGSVDNTSVLAEDYMVGASFTTHASNRQAGYIDVYAYCAFNVTPTWPDLFSSGTEGTEGAATVHDTEMLAGLRLIQSIECDNGASDVMTLPLQAIAHLFGGRVPPFIALFVTHNVATSTNAGLAAAGSAVYGLPVLDQYT